MQLILVPLVAGLLMSFVGSIPPIGPIAVLLLERGMSGKDNEGRGISLGAAIAETIYCGGAVTGMSALMDRYPIVATIARLVGVAILVGLGQQFARFKLKPPDPNAPAPKTGSSKPFMIGFGISIANPVLIVTWSGAIATFLAFTHAHFGVAEKTAFTVGVFCGVYGWFRVFLYGLSRYRASVTLDAAMWTVRVAGVAMIGMAAYFAVVTYRAM